VHCAARAACAACAARVRRVCVCFRSRADGLLGLLAWADTRYNLQVTQGSESIAQALTSVATMMGTSMERCVSLVKEQNERAAETESKLLAQCADAHEQLKALHHARCDDFKEVQVKFNDLHARNQDLQQENFELQKQQLQRKHAEEQERLKARLEAMQAALDAQSSPPRGAGTASKSSKSYKSYKSSKRPQAARSTTKAAGKSPMDDYVSLSDSDDDDDADMGSSRRRKADSAAEGASSKRHRGSPERMRQSGPTHIVTVNPARNNPPKFGFGVSLMGGALGEGDRTKISNILQNGPATTDMFAHSRKVKIKFDLKEVFHGQTGSISSLDVLPECILLERGLPRELRFDVNKVTSSADDAFYSETSGPRLFDLTSTVLYMSEFLGTMMAMRWLPVRLCVPLRASACLCVPLCAVPSDGPRHAQVCSQGLLPADGPLPPEPTRQEVQARLRDGRKARGGSRLPPRRA